MESPDTSAGVARMPPTSLKGEVIYIRAFDLAYDMKRQRLPRILGQPVQDYVVGPSKPAPKHGFFYRPQMVTLPSKMYETSVGPLEVSMTVKIFSVGAASIQVRMTFEVSSLQELVKYYDLSLAGRSMEAEIVAVAEQVRQELEPYLVRPVPALDAGEDYTVFCIYQLPPAEDARSHRAEDWLMQNRRAVAALLTQEQDAARLSDQEAVESTERYLTYYDTDLVVTDWDAALVVGEHDGLEEVVHVMELANVQLAELAVYDRVLDGALDLAYRDLARTRHVRREVSRNLREIRVDMARLNDELRNITKFFGDWHLAKIYQNLSDRFHLNDWHGIINVKLRTLADLYQILHQDWINSWMMVMEFTIILLFIIDVLLLLIGS
jgi:hypothetical protein